MYEDECDRLDEDDGLLRIPPLGRLITSRRRTTIHICMHFSYLFMRPFDSFVSLLSAMLSQRASRVRPDMCLYYVCL